MIYEDIDGLEEMLLDVSNVNDVSKVLDRYYTIH